jgi:hypothetical protein
MNLASILKMLGVKVPPEHIAAAEKLIPRLPELVGQVILRINDFGERQARIEKMQEENRLMLAEILQEVKLGRYDDSDTRPAGTGATQLLESASGV